MSRIVYIRAWPLDPATLALVPVYLAGGGSHSAYRLGGVQYRDGLVREPRFSARLGYGEGGWTGASWPTSSPIQFAPSDSAWLADLERLYWRDAAIEIDAGPEGGALVRRLTGTVADATVQDGSLVITAADASVRLGKPVAPDDFTGAGGIEGAEVAKGRRKRRTFARAYNVEGFLSGPAYQIYEFGDPARPLAGCTALKDMGREGGLAILADAGSPAATLAALRAASPDEGGGIFAPSIASARWWTDPAGPLTADIMGETGPAEGGKASDIAAALLTGTGTALADQAAVAALRPAPCAFHVGGDETVAQALDRLFLGLSLNWIALPSGAIAVRPWSFNGPVEALQAEFIGRDSSLPPVRTRKLGYKRNERQHGDGEISIAVPEGSSDAAVGTNVVINSEFVAALAGHSPGNNGITGLPIERGLNLPGWSGILNVAWARAVGTPSAGSWFDGYNALGGSQSDVAALKRWGLVVQPGERLYASLMAGPHRCGCYVNIQFHGVDGAYVGEAGGNIVGPDDAHNFAEGDPANALRSSLFVTVPSGARYAYIHPRAQCTGEADPYLFYSQLFLARVGPDQTEPPLYMPGPSDRAADFTSENTALNTLYVGDRSVAALLGTIDAIGADNVLSKGEKPQLQREWQALDSNQDELDIKAASLGVAAAERAAAESAVGALAAYLSGLVPGWTDVTSDTPIGSAYFANLWANAYSAVAALQAAIQGLPGAPGISALVVTCDPSSVNVPCAFNGTPKIAIPGFQIRVTQAGADVSALATYGAPIGVGVSGPSIDGDGTVSVTGLTAGAGSVRVPISYGGATAEASVAYLKVPDGSAAQRGEAAVTSLAPNATWQTSAAFDIMVAPGATLSANAYTNYEATAASYQPRIKLAVINMTDSGPEEDLSGSIATGETAFVSEPSYVATSGAWTNSTSISKVMRILLKSQRAAGAGASAYVTGSLGAVI